MKKESIFIILIIICVAIMVIYNQSDRVVKIEDQNTTSVRWNNIQKKYLSDKQEITIGVPEELLYLLEEEGKNRYQEGFLYDYLTEIFRKTEKTLTIVPMKSSTLGVAADSMVEVDCIISEITNPLREQSDIIEFSRPILKTNSSLFAKAGLNNKINTSSEMKTISYKGLAINSDLKTEKINDIKYKNLLVNFYPENSIKTMVNRGLAQEYDFIAGNQQAITIELLNIGAEDLYLDQNKVLYQRNVCIIVPRDEPVFYSIITNTLSDMDLKPILTRLQGKWYGLPTSFVKESHFTDLLLVIIIIFGAVLSVFFIYYNTNKNLYKELKTRMEALVTSQNEMRTTFNGVSYFMAELDTSGFILDINKAFLEFLNMGRQELIGKSFMEIWELPEDAKEEIMEAIGRISISKTSQNLEVTVGKEMYEIGLFPINTPKNQLEKILFIANDVTSVRTAKRQIIQDNKMIAVGQLAVGVAHEIRNPLGIIRNYCYLLKTMDPEDTEKKIQTLQIIERSVENSSKIINNLLNFSRISTTGKETLWIKQHFDSILFLNELKSIEKEIEIQVECEEDFQVELLKESFNMILVNLISNAIDASPEGGIINIKLLKKKDLFSVSVKDHGSGISKKDIESIYNPFFTTKTKKKGNGLGLYIVYNEINKMNGSIDVISEEGYGTEFYLEFPLER